MCVEGPLIESFLRYVDLLMVSLSITFMFSFFFIYNNLTFWPHELLWKTTHCVHSCHYLFSNRKCLLEHLFSILLIKPPILITLQHFLTYMNSSLVFTHCPHEECILTSFQVTLRGYQNMSQSNKVWLKTSVITRNLSLKEPQHNLRSFEHHFG